MGSEYQSIERVYSLLILLNNAPDEGFSREEVFAQIGLYDTNDTAKATTRMFEHDLAFLENLGFTIERIRHGRKGATYRVLYAEHVLTCPGQGPTVHLIKKRLKEPFFLQRREVTKSFGDTFLRSLAWPRPHTGDPVRCADVFTATNTFEYV